MLRIKNEINFLYKKKFQLNKQLYDLLINIVNTWGNVWLTVLDNIDNILDDIMKLKYNNMNKKLNNLKEDNKTHAV
jgi:hypothetical protein